MKIKKGHCKECNKKLSMYNKGRYCFACNAKCVVRDEVLILGAKKIICDLKLQLKILRSPERINKLILRHERMIEKQKKLIEKVRNYIVCIVPEKEEEYDY